MPASSNYTEQHLRKIWTKPGYEAFLRLGLAKLYELGTSETYLNEWINVLLKAGYVANTGQEGSREFGDPVGGLPTFLDRCLMNGVVEALLRVIRDSRVEIARFKAMLTWYQLLNAVDRHPKVIEAHANVQHLCTEVLMQSLQSNISVEKLLAIQNLRLWACTHWPRYIGNEKIAGIISACLTYALGDHEDIIRDSKNKQAVWQLSTVYLHVNQDSYLDVGHPAKGYGGVWSDEDIQLKWSVTRDEALEAIIKLLSSRDNARQRRDCLEILQHAPGIFDQLLVFVGYFNRPTYHQETESDATACLILVFLLSTPNAWLPEFSENSFCSSDSQFPLAKSSGKNVLCVEWEASLAIMKLFLRESKWKATLLRKWNKIEQESFKDILGKLQKAQKEKRLLGGIGFTFEHIYQKRGNCRASILRILTNLTYADASNEPLLPTNTLFSFLTLAYSACGKVPSPARAARSQRHGEATIGKLDYLLRKERLSSAFQRKPSEIVRAPTVTSIYIPPEHVLGPILLLRLLRRIGATYGKDIMYWTSLPENTLQNDHLGRVQQIASEEVLNIIIQNSVWKRIPHHKAEGTSFVKSDLSQKRLISQDVARQEYLTAAELALAVTVFVQEAGPVIAEWKDLIPTAQRDLVACLGNISFMSSKLDEWDRAWWYAKLALDCLEKVTLSQAKLAAWDPEAMQKKNQDRLAQAQQLLLTRASSA